EQANASFFTTASSSSSLDDVPAADDMPLLCQSSPDDSETSCGPLAIDTSVSITEDAAASQEGAAAVATVNPQLDKSGSEKQEAGAIEVKPEQETDPDAAVWPAWYAQNDGAAMHAAASGMSEVSEAAAATSGAAAVPLPPGWNELSLQIHFLTQQIGHLNVTVGSLAQAYQATQAQLDQTTATAQDTRNQSDENAVNLQDLHQQFAAFATREEEHRVRETRTENRLKSVEGRTDELVGLVAYANDNHEANRADIAALRKSIESWKKNHADKHQKDNRAMRLDIADIQLSLHAASDGKRGQQGASRDADGLDPGKLDKILQWMRRAEQQTGLLGSSVRDQDSNRSAAEDYDIVGDSDVDSSKGSRLWRLKDQADLDQYKEGLQSLQTQVQELSEASPANWQAYEDWQKFQADIVNHRNKLAQQTADIAKLSARVDQLNLFWENSQIVARHRHSTGSVRPAATATARQTASQGSAVTTVAAAATAQPASGPAGAEVDTGQPSRPSLPKKRDTSRDLNRPNSAGQLQLLQRDATAHRKQSNSDGAPLSHVAAAAGGDTEVQPKIGAVQPKVDTVLPIDVHAGGSDDASVSPAATEKDDQVERDSVLALPVRVRSGNEETNSQQLQRPADGAADSADRATISATSAQV
ncbi:MAG: hypothetical protein ACPIOQ_20645, partial [Promethearchaeia archaeon]